MLHSKLNVLALAASGINCINYVYNSNGKAKEFNKGLGCSECILAGYVYCKQRGWYEVITDTTPVDPNLPKIVNQNNLQFKNYGICCDPSTY
jgi:hypothetical protein